MSKTVYKVPECVLHSEAYLYYCQSCEEPICKKCTLIGPHNNQLHLCNHISESYRAKISEVGGLLNESLPAKRQLVLSQISRLEYALEETKTVKENILRYTAEKSLGILNRLEKSQEDRTLYLKNLIQGLYNDLNSINDIGHKFQEITVETNPNRMVQLLGNYKIIENQLQRLTNKIYNESISVSAEDLPRELSEMRWRLKKIKSYEEIGQSKYQIIGKVLEKRLQEQKKMQERINRQIKDQLLSWKRETQYNLNNFELNFLICHFCGKYMDEGLINEECKANSMIGADFKGYCETAPSYEYFSTNRHYFARSSSPILNTSDKVANLYLSILVSQLKISILSLNINLEPLILSHDPSSSGSIKRLDLLYILCEKCKLDQRTAQVLLSSLEPTAIGVKYNLLLKLLSAQ